ncbi:MAG: dihydrofolate reductase, partial [bacterium]|nr:dihydrofolate reductase [bacterium]
AIVKHFKGDRNTEEFKKFMVYTKRVWFSKGIHHHYSTSKLIPGFAAEYFAQLVKESPEGDFPLAKDETVEQLVSQLTPIIFDATVDGKLVSSNTKGDLVADSAVNFYEGLTQKEVEDYYKKIIKKGDPKPISYGLNSKLVKTDGKIEEKVWKIGGMYSKAIEKVVYWLEKASAVAENPKQKKALDLLIKYYQTGDLKLWDEYSIAWSADVDSRVDVVNGFIEVYGDPLNYRAAYEAVVSFKDLEATKRAEAVSDNAQWFEENSPIAKEHKKEKVTGVSAKVITVAALSGATSPSPPIGINLPNANWIRSEHGSKSVTLGNVFAAHGKIGEGSGMLKEFFFSQEMVDLGKKYGTLSGNLHVDMHEIIGHGSGRINQGVGTPKETLKSYASTIEETRADLVALYFILDPKLKELGLTDSTDVGKVAYNRNVANGLMMQLTRIKLGDDVEQAHMRNRQLIAAWAMELGKDENVIEKKIKDGKTYFVVNDHQKLRVIYGKMLKEIQRIKSEGDYKKAKELVETYAVKIDPVLHKEVLDRFAKLNIAPYTGFVCPELKAVEKDGKITEVTVDYPMDFVKQMLFYAENYSFLPTYN